MRFVRMMITMMSYTPFFSRANELSFGEFVDICDFETLCHEMLSNILNDEDYRAIISFIRPKLSFVDDWREV